MFGRKIRIGNIISHRGGDIYGHLAGRKGHHLGEAKKYRLETGSDPAFDVYQPCSHYPLRVFSKRTGGWSCAAPGL